MRPENSERRDCWKREGGKGSLFGNFVFFDYVRIPEWLFL
jgi:hypothetical protein